MTLSTRERQWYGTLLQDTGYERKRILNVHLQKMSQTTQFAWSWIAQNALLPAGDKFYGQPMMEHLRFLRKAQWWSRDQLEDYRNKQVRELITTAYLEVPFYRALMRERDLKPQDFHRVEDLRMLPIVTKDMLRSGYPHETVRDTGQKTYEACSSGSTGKPFCVREDWETAGIYRAAFLLAMEWTGWRIGIPHVQTGIMTSRSQGRAIKDFILRCHYVSSYDLHDEQLDQTLDLLERKRIQFLWGYPSGIYHLARRAIQKGWNMPLRAVATWGDTLYAHYRSTIESAFKTKVFDKYGIGEGITISAQCGVGSHYHIFSPDVVVEYVDQDEQPVPEGEIGDLIITRLHPGPMPLIRYRVGDVGVSGASRTCECGRNFEIQESILGRETDAVITPSGNRLIVHFFTGILEFFSEIDSFQVIQDAPDYILLRIQPRADAIFNQAVINRVIGQLKQHGADIDIHVELVDSIPTLPNGKRRFVINNLSTEAIPVR